MRWTYLLGLTVVALMACPAANTGADGGGSVGDAGGGGGSGGGAGGGAGWDAGPLLTADGGLASAPTWTTLTAQGSGRTGKDLLLSLKAKDRNQDALGVSVRLLDSAGAAVGASATAAFTTTKWVSEALTATVVLRKALAGPAPAQVAVTLFDASGLRSDERVEPLGAQPVKALGEPCDPSFVQSRCDTSLGCRGTPPVCAEGVAPQVVRLAFYRGTPSPVILMEGTEPEDDLSLVRLQFQNAAGQSISIDSDGDGVPDMASFDYDAHDAVEDGAFFIHLDPAAGLDTQVPKLVATPIDAAGHTGTPKSTTPTAVPVKLAGQDCDLRGFDVCGPALTCWPGLTGQANRCSSSPPLRAAQCASAPVLVPTAAGAMVMGVAEGGSLWDVPAGCASGDPRGRPEGVVKLHVTDRIASLTLSTAGPSTTFDTQLYVLFECPQDSLDALGCNDDSQTAAPTSELVLTDVAPGDYLVVVESFDARGGTFELHATAQ